MPISEKELYANLFNQLTLIERIERSLINGGEKL